MAAKRFFITTSIPYVNARPHIGHALEFVQADAYRRFQQLLGNDTYLLVGSDDNALKNVQAADAAGMPVADYVEKHSAIFKGLHTKLGISADYFISTSADQRHKESAQKLWSSCRPEDIYKKKYRGFYCIGCEEFKTEKDLVHGECPEHPGKKLEEVEEENYFFRLTNYAARLRELIESDTLKITPTTRKNEALAFIRGGLEDFSISRSVERARGWGVPVPGDDAQVMYVWFDALANYITALDYDSDGEAFKHWWQDASSVKQHFIGKGINRFHTIYWPAMLLSAGLALPSEVVVHGYLTVGGQKMSKSLGNTIDPEDLIAEYGTDAVRYFLLRHVHPFEDSDVTLERFREIYNAHLANGLGNLVARVLTLSEKHLDIKREARTLSPDATATLLKDYRMDQYLDGVWSLIQGLDRQITETKPFEVIKSDESKGKALINELVGGLYSACLHLKPIMPHTSQSIEEAILANKKPENLFLRKE
jgi:methionyl-tRNA synthetase